MCLQVLLLVAVLLRLGVGSMTPTPFKFIHITDSQVGGSKGTLESKTPTEYFQEVVTTINNLASTDSLLRKGFVVLTGDVTDKGDNASFILAADILSNLTIPWFVAIGDHDIYRTTPTPAETSPTGDARMNELVISRMNKTWITHSTFDVSVQNSELTPAVPTNFINYQFEANGVVFMVLDWASRLEMHSVSGAKPPNQHDIDGGTLRWLTTRLEALGSRSDVQKIVLFFHAGFYAPLWSSLNKWAADRMEAVRKVLLKAPAGKLWGDFSGRYKEFYDKTPFEDDEAAIAEFRELQTGPITKGVKYRVVSFSQDGSDWSLASESFGAPLVSQDWIIYVAIGGGVGGAALILFCIIMFVGICCCICCCCRKSNKVTPSS